MLFEMPSIKEVEVPDKGAGYIVDSNIMVSPQNKIHEVLELVLQYDTITWYSNGEWNMFDMLRGLLEMSGKADVFISSYGFSDHAARAIADLKATGLIKTLSCILDNRIDTRSASALNIIRNCSDQYKLCNTHAKVTIVKSKIFQAVVVGSANYTENKRYEAGTIFKNENIINFHLNWILNELKTK